MSLGIVAMKRRTLALCVAALCSAATLDNALALDRLSRDRLPPHLQAAMPSAPGRFAPLGTIPVTNCDDSGAGSLRDAVASAASGDAIDMTALSCSQITLTTGAIVIGQHDLAFQGPGRDKLTLSADGSEGSAVLYHLGGGTLFVDGVSIVDGSKYTTDHDARGGCIYTNGYATLEHVAVRNCKAQTRFPYAAFGGGVYARFIAYLLDTEVTGNEASSVGGYANGGGVFGYEAVQTNYARISGNRLVGQNSWGGGLSTRGSAFIQNSEISGNEANNRAGVSFANAGASAVMINSTVSGNVASHTVGGVYSRSPLFMYNCTVAFNTEEVWNDGAGQYFGAGVNINVVSTIWSSILSNNTAPGVGTPGDIFDLSGNAPGIEGGDDVIMEFNIGLPASVDHGDPGLLPLADNGGRTRTHVPTSSNTNGFGDNMLNLQFDQRGHGFPRETAAGITIGAYELNPDVIFANGFN
jgi:hypothetical protein